MKQTPLLLLGLVASSALSFGVAGCYASVEPEPVGYAEVTAAPVGIETYPSIVYEGHPTYFNGDRWWYRDGGRWAYYREEPEALRRQRPTMRRGPAVRRPTEHREEPERR